MALGDLVASLAADPGASGLDAIKQRQLLAQQLMTAGGSTAPIQSPWQGVANLVKGLQGGLEGALADKQQKDWTQTGNDAFTKALSSFGSPTAAPATLSGTASDTPNLPAFAGGGKPMTLPGYSTAYDPAATETLIRQKAPQYGIDPDVAVKVARSEGLNAYTGDSGSSFGPLQLHYGNIASGGNAVGGLGDEFTKATGLDARDPSTVPAQIDFALAHVAKNGWGAFHGAANSGIDNFAGIGQSAASAPVQVASNNPAQAMALAAPAAAAPAAAAISAASPAAASQPIAVPGYDGQFTRDQANDAEGVPSQAEWDAAAKAAGTGAAASPSPQVAAAAPVAPSAAAPAKPGISPELQRVYAAIADPHVSAAQRQVLGLYAAQLQKNDTLINAGSGYLYNSRTGQWIASPGAGKDDATVKSSIIGEDQYGRKIYGTVDKSGNPHPFQLPQASGNQPITSLDAMNLHGEDYMKTLDPQMQGQVRAIVEGRAPYPTGMLLKTPYGQHLAAMVTQADPSFEAGNATARQKTLAQFKSGKATDPGGAINAGNTAIMHLGELSDAAERLENSSIPAYNTAKNWIGTQRGENIPLVDFNNAREKFSEEVTKFYRGTGGTEADIERANKSLNPDQSPAQLRAAIQTQAQLMRDKISAYQNTWHNAMGPMVPDFPIVSKEAQTAYDRIQQRRAGTAPPPSPGTSSGAAPKRYKYDTSGNLVPQ